MYLYSGQQRNKQQWHHMVDENWKVTWIIAKAKLSKNAHQFYVSKGKV